MNFQTFQKTLKELVDKCDELIQNPPRGVKPEELVKDKLLVPLLDSLGYDSNHRDVEAQIEAKWVDYTLLSHNKEKLAFIEAKSLEEEGLWEKYKRKVFEYIQTYQALAQTDKPVLWIILTNFKELYLYRLHSGQNAHWSFKSENYLQDALLLWDLLERNNFEKGVIESRFKEDIKSDIDKRFLEDLKRWRLILANGFYKSNPKLTIEELKTASQQIIDRLIFIRLLETEILRPYGWLIKQYNLWKESVNAKFTPFAHQLKLIFKDIERDFNTELFRQGICDTLEIPDKFIEVILFKDQPLDNEIREMIGAPAQLPLWNEQNTIYDYDFNTLTIDIMGSVYERFLAHNFELTEKGITIKDSKVLRKKEGIYYTPPYIVNTIVKNTVGEKLDPIFNDSIALLEKGKYKEAYEKITEISKIKIVDPAMGSGSFLLAVYDYIFRLYQKYNEKCSEMESKEQSKRKGSLDLFAIANLGILKIDDVGRRILRENIHGVDLDPQAVEVAKLNLWAKLLRTESHLFKSGNSAVHLLPNLEQNLKHGNSLISGIESRESLRKIVSKLKEIYKKHKEALKEGDREIAVNKNKEVVSLEKQLQSEINKETLEKYYGNQWEALNPFIWEISFPTVFLNEDGTLKNNPGFDVVLGNPPYGAELTSLDRKYFEKCFLVAKSNKNTASMFIELAYRISNSDAFIGYIVPKSLTFSEKWSDCRTFLLNNLPIKLLIDASEAFSGVLLEQVVFISDKSRGKSLSYKAGKFDNEQVVEIKDIPTQIVREFDAFLIHINNQDIEIFNKIKTKSIFLHQISETFRGLPAQQYLLNDIGKTPIIRGEEVQRYFLKDCVSYIDSSKLKLFENKIKRLKEPKILSQNIVAYVGNPYDRIVLMSTLDDKGLLNLDTVNNTVLKRGVKYDLRYLLAFLNSKIVNWFTYFFIYNKAVRTMHFDSYYVGRIPIYKIDFSNKKELIKHTNLTRFAHQMLTLKKLQNDFFKLFGEEINQYRSRTRNLNEWFLGTNYKGIIEHRNLLDNINKAFRLIISLPFRNACCPAKFIWLQASFSNCIKNACRMNYFAFYSELFCFIN
ncbi:MAG: N-6 DNA methylase [Candidatus Omnitrophica bacterium]|nr:N-6 DNA methylase [Candidatus Omnitrophota bacterium]